MTQTEALRLALEALIACRHLLEIEVNKAIARDASDAWIREKGAELRQHNNAITAIKAALEAQTRSVDKDEPVAWRTFNGEGGYDYRTYENNEDYANDWDKRNPKHKRWIEPLYRTPLQRTRIGLTEAECGVLWKVGMTPFDYYQAIKAKLEEKNT